MSTTTKISKRERFTSIIEVLSAVEGTEELVAFCEKEIGALDRKSEKAKEAAAKKRAASDELTEVVHQVLTEEAQTIAAITAQIEGEDVTTAKITNRLTRLVNEGVAVREEVVIEATETTKRRKVAAYRLA